MPSSNASRVARSLRPTSVNDLASVRRTHGHYGAIEQVGARLHFLPPYNPDLNRIELGFAKLKAFIRAVRARSCDQVVELFAIACQKLF